MAWRRNFRDEGSVGSRCQTPPQAALYFKDRPWCRFRVEDGLREVLLDEMNIQNKGRFLSGVSLAIGLVLAAWIGAGALVRIKTQDQTITVMGSARRQIV